MKTDETNSNIENNDINQDINDSSNEQELSADNIENVEQSEQTEKSDDSTQSSVSDNDESVKKISELESKNAELNDKYIRLVAEFENFKKRTRQEHLTLIETAASGLIKDLLPIIDDLERGIEFNKSSEDVKSISDGFSLIYNKYLNILKNKGLESIEEAGVDFDTDFHEALTMVEKEGMKGKVVEVIEKGYLLKGKVIRFAKVIVGK